MQKITLQLEPLEAKALAVMAKRFTRTEALELSTNPEEAAQMMHGLYELQTQLDNQEQTP
jgi:hypothetical protein